MGSSAIGQKYTSGAKAPHFLLAFSAWAKAQAYLKKQQKTRAETKQIPAERQNKRTTRAPATTNETVPQVA
jgi:hypothetical protein